MNSEKVQKAFDEVIEDFMEMPTDEFMEIFEEAPPSDLWEIVVKFL